jgi:hypothetical protein
MECTPLGCCLAQRCQLDTELGPPTLSDMRYPVNILPTVDWLSWHQLRSGAPRCTGPLAAQVHPYHNTFQPRMYCNHSS